jgi:dTDP-4-dehydrorhamnose reductase
MSGSLLVTGGSGLLGRHLRPLLPGALFPSHSEFDVTVAASAVWYLKDHGVTTVLHAAAFTSPPKINADPAQAVAVNILGTGNLVRACLELGVRLVYISTDYVFDGSKGLYEETDPVLPVNKYAWSKLGGECAVRLLDNSLIVRLSFGDRPFPYDKAFVDQWTSRLPVDDAARRIAAAAQSALTGVLHIGGPRRSVMEYARFVSPEKTVGELSLKDVTFTAPRDTSLNTARYDRELGDRRAP